MPAGALNASVKVCGVPGVTQIWFCPLFRQTTLFCCFVQPGVLRVWSKTSPEGILSVSLPDMRLLGKVSLIVIV